MRREGPSVIACGGWNVYPTVGDVQDAAGSRSPRLFASSSSTLSSAAATAAIASRFSDSATSDAHFRAWPESAAVVAGQGLSRSSTCCSCPTGAAATSPLPRAPPRVDDQLVHRRHPPRSAAATSSAAPRPGRAREGCPQAVRCRMHRRSPRAGHARCPRSRARLRRGRSRGAPSPPTSPPRRLPRRGRVRRPGSRGRIASARRSSFTPLAGALESLAPRLRGSFVASGGAEA